MIRKNIEHGNDFYTIDYYYEREKCINGNTYHELIIGFKNNIPITPFLHKWTDKGNESIIYHCSRAIKEYLTSEYKPISKFEEFNKWDGNLNIWDE